MILLLPLFLLLLLAPIVIVLVGLFGIVMAFVNFFNLYALLGGVACIIIGLGMGLPMLIDFLEDRQISRYRKERAALDTSPYSTVPWSYDDQISGQARGD